MDIIIICLASFPASNVNPLTMLWLRFLLVCTGFSFSIGIVLVRLSCRWNRDSSFALSIRHEVFA